MKTSDRTADLENTHNSCQCDGSLTLLQLQYIGDYTASNIALYGYDSSDIKRVICEFQYVPASQEIICDISSNSAVSKYFNGGKFPTHTHITVSYSDSEIGGNCTGYIDTSCGRDIVGDLDHGCGDLMVRAWSDIDREICDEAISQNRILAIRDFGGDDRDWLDDSEDKKTDAVLTHILAVSFGLVALASIACFVKCIKNVGKAYGSSVCVWPIKQKRKSTDTRTLEGMTMMTEFRDSLQPQRNMTMTIELSSDSSGHENGGEDEEEETEPAPHDCSMTMSHLDMPGASAPGGH